MLGTHVVSLPTGEIELPKKKRVFDRITSDKRGNVPRSSFEAVPELQTGW